MKVLTRVSTHVMAVGLASLLGAGCDQASWLDFVRQHGPPSSGDHGHGGDGCGAERDDSADARAAAQRKISWRDEKAACAAPIDVQLLSFNDFHGQLSTGRKVSNRPVGGAAVFVSYLKAAAATLESTFIVHAGDHVGASPPNSALLQDEPAISVLNTLTNESCGRHGKTGSCNVIGTLGNHEFDEGRSELLRLLFGGNHEKGPFLESPWRGARFPYVSANVVDSTSSKPLLHPSEVVSAKGVRIAFIGAVLKQTPTIVTPAGVAGLSFLDEADAINAEVARLEKQGVHAFVVLIHQGGRQNSYTGATKADAPTLDGVDISGIVSRLSASVDVVVSGHAHQFTNTLLPNAGGKMVLVTQAFSAGTAYGDIDLQLDPRTGDVIAKTASIETTWGDAGPGLAPDAHVAEIVAAADAQVAPLVNRLIGTAAVALTRTESPAGESALGNLIADAQRASVGADVAFMNPGGIRADLDAGEVTWGELFTIQPFANDVVKLTLTGQQIVDVLEQQWLGQTTPRILKTSGFTYVWDDRLPVGSRVSAVVIGGVPVDLTASYTVAANSFIAGGGDGFNAFTGGTNKVVGPVDLAALVDFIAAQPQPFSAAIEGRIVRAQ